MASDMRQLIVATAGSLGIRPVDLATAISYETAGTFDPTKRGPTTQWGQHRGLIQFGEPQAKKYGVDWNNPVESQLGPDGAVAKYLRDTGVKPGMGMVDIYSAINAGGVGRYGASDANNGGAPGTVADKVNNQMAGHRQKAESLLGDYAGMADGPKGQEQYNPVFGSMSPTPSPPTDNSIDPAVAQYAFAEEPKPLGDRLAKAGRAFDDAVMPAARPLSSFPGGPSGDQANGLLKLLQNPQALAQMFSKQRMG